VVVDDDKIGHFLGNINPYIASDLLTVWYWNPLKTVMTIRKFVAKDGRDFILRTLIAHGKAIGLKVLSLCVFRRTKERNTFKVGFKDGKYIDIVLMMELC